MERPASQPITQTDLGLPDYDEIIALWQRAGLHVRPEGRDGPAAFAQQLAAGVQRIVGLRGGNRLVGVVVLTHDGRKGWVNRLAVDPAYRRRGLAQMLIAEAEQWFTAELGLEVWAALIESQNHASRSLFAQAGYRQLDVVYVSKRTREDA